MSNIIVDFFLQRNRATLLIFTIIILTGLNIFSIIPKEKTPDVKIPIIMVNSVLNGASPKDTERLLARPMENALRSVENIKKMTSVSTDGRAYVILEFSAGFNSDKALEDTRAKIDEITPDLPNEAKRPIVQEVNMSLFPILNVIIAGNFESRTMLQIAKNLQKSIEGLPNVLSVDIAGYRKDRVDVIIDPKILATYNLQIEKVAQMLRRNNQLIAAGKFFKSGYSVRVDGVLEKPDEILQLPIIADKDSVITIKDVAHALPTFEDPVSYARVNGKPAIVLEISKRTGKNIIETIEQVKGVVKKEKAFLPKSLQIMYSFDQSDQVKEVLNDLKNNIILAVIFVAVIMGIYMGTKIASIVAVCIPGSFLIGVIAVYMLGYTMNIVVLFSLIMSIGMLVDASIIVNEYADRKMNIGHTPMQAYKEAATRVFWPVVSSTVTTLVVFMPLLFWPGVAGQFMKYLPITLIATLSGSIFISLCVTPVIGGLFGGASTSDRAKIAKLQAIEGGDLNSVTGFVKKYYSLLQSVLKRPKTFVGAIVGSLFVAIISYGFIGKGVEFFPDVEPESSVISIRSQGNISLDTRDKIMAEVESKILDMKEVKIFYARAGTFSGPENNTDDVIARIQMELANWQKRRKANEILKEVAKRLNGIPGVITEIENQKDGPSSNKPIEIQISGKNHESIKTATSQIKTLIKNIKGITNVTDDGSTPEIEWKITVNRNKASRNGIDVATIGEYIKMITEGALLTEYRPDYSDDEVEIRARFPKELRNISALKNIMIGTPSGSVPVASFIDIKPQLKLKQVHRVNSDRTTTITAGVLPGFVATNMVKKAQTALLNLNIPTDVSIKFTGEQEDQQEAKSFLTKAFVSALFIMVLVLLLQFNSYYQVFIIMTAVFLSTTGVFLGLILTNQTFGIVMCGVGIISLAGIVVNNNILLIDAYNEHVQNGENNKNAVIKAAVSRLRPILLTAGTTILGLLPMVLTINIDFINLEVTYNAPSGQWWKQLATSISGGLAFATVLTLFFTPALLLIGDKKSD